MVYVSYDGMGEPLGRSQVVSYLTRLAGRYAITLISFEKAEASTALADELRAAGIEWVPLRYHSRPAVLATAADILRGAGALAGAARRRRPAVVHVRSYVPALIALLARPLTGGRLLFDIRGFWADERVEGGIWPPGGILYRIAKRCERRFFREADAVVTLTHASVPQIRELVDGRDIPIDVIPTCVALQRFAAARPRPEGPRVIWSGSIGTWYRFDLAPKLAAALSLELTVITRQTDLARRTLGGYPAAVRSVDPDEMPRELFARDVGLTLIAQSSSKIASAPTRFAEYLAAGMPVIVTPIGDLRTLVERHRVGVVLEDEDERSIQAAACAMHRLMRDPDLPGRCRRLAQELFDVEAGSARYAAIYDRLQAAPSGRPRSLADRVARSARQSR